MSTVTILYMEKESKHRNANMRISEGSSTLTEKSSVDVPWHNWHKPEWQQAICPVDTSQTEVVAGAEQQSQQNLLVFIRISDDGGSSSCQS